MYYLYIIRSHSNPTFSKIVSHKGTNLQIKSNDFIHSYIQVKKKHISVVRDMFENQRLVFNSDTGKPQKTEWIALNPEEIIKNIKFIKNNNLYNKNSDDEAEQNDIEIGTLPKKNISHVDNFYTYIYIGVFSCMLFVSVLFFIML